jgi:hypothetical protein
MKVSQIKQPSIAFPDESHCCPGKSAFVKIFDITKYVDHAAKRYSGTLIFTSQNDPYITNG